MSVVLAAQEIEMKKYSVLLSVDATVYVVVEANSEEEAKEKAYEVAHRPSLCHQCAKEMDTGDIIEALEATEISG